MQHDFILLDRSGSMSSQWNEALGAINAYVKKLAEDKVDTGVTVACFDLNGPQISFDVVRERIIPSTFHPLTSADASPRGSTPLNDAVGKIVALAKAGNYDKLALIIMTDGEENSSRELNHTQAKALLDECRAKNWQVIFLGANFDNWAQAQSYGGAYANTIQASTANLAATMSMTGAKRAAYGISGQSMDYTEEEKQKAKS